MPLIENGNDDLDPTIETENNHSSDEINPSKRGKRIRKRKRKQVPGNDLEVPDVSTSGTVVEASQTATVKSNKLLKESRNLFTELSLTNDVRAPNRKTPSHIRSVRQFSN